ncbi:MAG: hypothetical protein ACLUUO_07290 [Sellimonas intestinalis]
MSHVINGTRYVSPELIKSRKRNARNRLYGKVP